MSSTGERPADAREGSVADVIAVLEDASAMVAVALDLTETEFPSSSWMSSPHWILNPLW